MCRIIAPFILTLSMALILVSCSSNQQFDQYGGILDLSTEPSGFFSIHQSERRYYLVTPEGHAFLAVGINHFHMIKITAYDSIVGSLKSMGFNSGCYQGPKWMWNRFPYTQGINLVETCSFYSEDRFSFEDVFDSLYLKRIASKIKQIVSPQANNKYLIAYFLTDIPVWHSKKFGMGWIDFYKSLPDEASGRRVWNHWRLANPNLADEDFIPVIARQIYSNGTALIRKYDQNHLIFSDRYHEEGFPDDVAMEALPFVDGIATQPSSHLNLKYFKTLFSRYRKPIFIADYVSSFKTPEYPNSMEQIADNPDDYYDFYRSYIYNVLSLPYVIGVNKCQYMDENRDGVLKQGLIREDGRPYPYLNRLANAHQRALRHAYKFSR